VVYADDDAVEKALEDAQTAVDDASRIYQPGSRKLIEATPHRINQLEAQRRRQVVVRLESIGAGCDLSP